MTIKKNVLYWVGKPEVMPSGRFGKRVTTYTTAIMNDDGLVMYGKQSYSSLGKLGVPKDVIKVTKSEFLSMLKGK
jgi:hypothetical protein